MNAVLEKIEINRNVKRGEIWWADLRGGIGAEQSGIRPVILIQSIKGDIHAPTTKIAPITSSENKSNLPTHVKFDGKKYGLKLENAVALLEQSRVIDKMRLMSKISALDEEMMKEVNYAILVSYDLQ